MTATIPTPAPVPAPCVPKPAHAWPDLIAFSAAPGVHVAHVAYCGSDGETWHEEHPVIGWAVTRDRDHPGRGDTTVEAMVQLDHGSAELMTVRELVTHTANAELVGVFPIDQPPTDAEIEHARSRVRVRGTGIG